MKYRLMTVLNRDIGKYYVEYQRTKEIWSPIFVTNNREKALQKLKDLMDKSDSIYLSINT